VTELKPKARLEPLLSDPVSRQVNRPASSTNNSKYERINLETMQGSARAPEGGGSFKS